MPVGFTAKRLVLSALLSSVFAAVYWLLFWAFCDALDASARMSDVISSSEWGGPADLFLLASGISGWAFVALAAHHSGLSGPVVFLLALPWWLGAISGGFLLAAATIESLSVSMWEPALFCVATAAGTAAFRTWINDTAHV